MIVYGLTMQGKPEQVPLEVATWLFERNTLYPNIDFKINVTELTPSLLEEYASIVQQYSRLFYWSGIGLRDVAFLYHDAMWHVAIVGGLDPEGNIADMGTFKGEIRRLPFAMREEIAGYTSTMEQVRIGEETVGIPRTSNEPLGKPTQMVPFPPDFRYTSEISLSGAEFHALFAHPTLGKAASDAFWAKDWKALGRLKAQL